MSRDVDLRRLPRRFVILGRRVCPGSQPEPEARLRTHTWLLRERQAATRARPRLRRRRGGRAARHIGKGLGRPRAGVALVIGLRSMALGLEIPARWLLHVCLANALSAAQDSAEQARSLDGHDAGCW